jgi:hypothetical protein
MTMADKPIRPGRWRHFKGGLYEVLTEAKHTERDEELVIYRSLDDGCCYARPRRMFLEWVKHEGKLVARFTPLDD